MILTILTPTWNRRQLLPRLYESILRQAAPEGSFEWLVIDDGSTDETAAYLSELAERHPGFIRFQTMSNGGKHRALNCGAKMARGQWTMVVDSDDWLADDAVAKLSHFINVLGHNQDIAVINGLYHFSHLTQQPMVLVRQNPCPHHTWTLQQKPFDTVYVFRSKVLINNTFPTIPGENFMSEGWLYYQISKYYLTYFTNEILVHCAYQPDGMSANSVKIRVKSPLSAMIVYNQLSSFSLTTRRRSIAAVNFWRFYFHYNKRHNMFPVIEIKFSYVWAFVGYLMFVIDSVRHRN